MPKLKKTMPKFKKAMSDGRGRNGRDGGGRAALAIWFPQENRPMIPNMCPMIPNLGIDSTDQGPYRSKLYAKGAG